MFAVLFALAQPVPEAARLPEPAASDNQAADCQMPRSFNDMNACPDNEYAKTFFELEEAWVLASRAASDYDNANFEETGERPMSMALSRVHSKWLGYRDDQCGLMIALKQDQVTRGQVWSRCMAALTSSRVQQLRDYATMIESLGK